MRRKKKKAVLRAAFAYLLLSGGSWMFINACANSYNRLNSENIVPVGLTVQNGTAALDILDHHAEIGISAFAPDSKLYCGAYLLSPDEVRAAAYIISLCI